jgi:hypothetical protein
MSALIVSTTGHRTPNTICSMFMWPTHYLQSNLQPHYTFNFVILPTPTTMGLCCLLQCTNRDIGALEVVCYPYWTHAPPPSNLFGHMHPLLTMGMLKDQRRNSHRLLLALKHCNERKMMSRVEVSK